MAGLNFGQPSLGINEFETRTFTQTYSVKAQQIVNEGVAFITNFTFGARTLVAETDNMGSQINLALTNESGGSRNITIIITNETQGTTLFSSSVDLGDGASSIFSEFYSLEQINNLDTVKVAFGNEGVGTAVASSTFGSYQAELNSIFIAQDESS